MPTLSGLKSGFLVEESHSRFISDLDTSTYQKENLVSVAQKCSYFNFFFFFFFLLNLKHGGCGGRKFIFKKLKLGTIKFYRYGSEDAYSLVRVATTVLGCLSGSRVISVGIY